MNKPNSENDYTQILDAKFELDFLFEEYVRAWMAYHIATNRVDGHTILGSPEQIRLVSSAVKAGLVAMREVIPLASLIGPYPEKKEWNRAKLEALRRLGF